MRAFLGALFFRFAALLCAATALAESIPIPHGKLELVAEKQWLQAGSAADIGLHFQLENGWHIYWINPGDSGEPPRVDWQLPTGVTAGSIEWPAPQRFQTSSSIVDYGYVDSVLLIVPLHVNADVARQAAAHIGAAVRLLICSHEMCVPGKAQLSLNLPVKSQAAPDTRNADLFRATRKSLPRPAPSNWKLSALDAKDSFVLSVNLGRQIASGPISLALFFPLTESQIENAASQQMQTQAAGFQLRLRESGQLLKPLDRLRGVLVLSGDESFLIDVPVSIPAAIGKQPR